MHPNDITRWSALLDAAAQRLGTASEGGAFWFEMQGGPVVTVELLPDPPAVLLHATIGWRVSQHEGLVNTSELLSANAPDASDEEDYLAINSVEDSLLLFHRLTPAELAGADSALEAMIRFSASAAQAAARMPPGLRMHKGPTSAQREDEPQDLATVDEFRRRFAGVWDDLVRSRGLTSDEGQGDAAPDDDEEMQEVLAEMTREEIHALETTDGALLLVECEPARGTVLLSAVLGYLPLLAMDDSGEDEHAGLRPLLESHLGGNGTFAVNKFDELVLHRRLPLDGLDALDLWNAAEALASAAAHYAGELGLKEAMPA